VDDDKQPDKKITPADILEANARAGLARGGWGSLSSDARGNASRPLGAPAPVRSAVESGEIGWVDAYLDSEAAASGRIDLAALRLAEPEPPTNRAQRRGQADKVHASLRRQKRKKAKRR
jgi:hypothetical protein